MPVDPRELREAIGTADAVIDSHMPCKGCGYDLYGLRIGSACPECGREALLRPQRARADTLVEAPLLFVTTVAIGSGLLVFALLLGVLSPVVASTGGRGADLALFASACWVVGLFLATPARPPFEGERRRGGALGEWGALRWVSRLSQCAWVVMTALLALASVPEWMTLGLSAVGVVGLFPMGLLLARYAEWACDDWVAGLFRGSVYGVCLCAALMLAERIVSAVLGAPMLGFIPLALFILLVVAAGAYLLGLANLAWTMWMAISSVRRRIARDAKLVEKMRRERARQREIDAREGVEGQSPVFRKMGTAPRAWEREG